MALSRYTSIFSIFTSLCSFTIQAQNLPNFRIKEASATEQFKKGLLLYHNQSYQAASTRFERALELSSNFYLARRFLGDALYYSGEWDRALEEWEFLNKSSEGSYPLVQLRSQLLRSRLSENYTSKNLILTETFKGKRGGLLGNKNFEGPLALAFDTQGAIYMASWGSSNILKISPSGEVQMEIKGQRWPWLPFPFPWFKKFIKPSALAIDKDGNIYVSDYLQDRIQVFDARGRSLYSFGGSGDTPGHFHGPVSLLLINEILYVSDEGNRRIQKFSLDGTFLQEFGKDEEGQSPLAPAGLAFEPSKQYLYLADRKGGRILSYDLEGSYIKSIQTKELEHPLSLYFQNDTLVITDERRGLALLNISQKKLRFITPSTSHFSNHILSAGFSPSGILYVTDYEKNELLSFAPLDFRINNFNVKIQRVDISAFPLISIFSQVEDQRGRAIKGLSKASFSLKENDTPIRTLKINNIIPYNRRLNVAIVKEHTTYFDEYYSHFVSNTLDPLIRSLRISDSMYIFTAGREARLVYEGLGRTEAMSTLNQKSGLSSSDKVNIFKGIHLAIETISKRAGARGVVVLVSGKKEEAGLPFFDKEHIKQLALSHNIPLHFISYEGESKLEDKNLMIDFYTELSKATHGSYHRAFDKKEMEELYELLFLAKDQRYIITYDSNLSSKNKGRYADILLEVKNIGSKGLADSGFFVP